ncbi:cell division protein FtsQ/DivIB [Teredinibacter franksiae]|uniref:cell division protein FtsQ/DivIB n=1 Tax=Teredinibacter franksiae TaxID=2761453 RepID=UPI001623A409|nr:FtsQ-type POTRA domain-containing protein [Teredinibacter franksiae]
MAERAKNNKNSKVYTPRGSRSNVSSGRPNSRGAVRKGRVQGGPIVSIPWALLLKGVCFSTLLAFGIWKIDWLAISNKVQQQVNKPVANVSVKGEFTHLSQSDLQALVTAHIQGNFMQVDIEDLRANLHTNPWVQAVRVQRVWPDGLSIDVREQKPIARWNSTAFISNEGEVITIGDNSHLAYLPLLAGPVKQSSLITRTYLDMTEMLASRNIGLTGIDVDATHAWRIKLSNGIEIVFGQYDVLNKLRNFLLVFDQKLRGVSEKIVRVDMRYDSGMAVAWNKDTESDLQASR